MKLVKPIQTSPFLFSNGCPSCIDQLWWRHLQEIVAWSWEHGACKWGGNGGLGEKLSLAMRGVEEENGVAEC